MKTWIQTSLFTLSVLAVPYAYSASTADLATTTPIQHVVVIFDENESFDHYFGTYPNAANPVGETPFTAAPGTPTPNNFVSNPTLLTANPTTKNASNGTGAINPFRLDYTQAFANTQDHSYLPEQQAFDGGNMDLFPFTVGAGDTPAQAGTGSTAAQAQTTGLTMGYFDGNTVTALWNYAQLYSMSDAYFGTTFGGSTLGAINLASGQTNGVINDIGSSADIIGDGYGGYTLTDDSDPTGDICSSKTASVHMTGKNIGDLLTAANASWGWFQGGFDTTRINPNGTTGCHRKTLSSVTQLTEDDYVPRHEPFQFYASTANPNHTRPTSTAAIGKNADAANHQYDSNDFLTALAAGNMPAVSFLKATQTQDSHAGTSDPIDEQQWLVTLINAIQASPFWQSTAIIVAYDDSDGWYDHVTDIVNGSATAQDAYTSTGVCSSGTATGANALPGVQPTTLHAQGRCGHGPRLPLLVISPWANSNSIDSTLVDQTSITRFIEDTFLSGQRIGGGSYDSLAGSLNNLFNFSSSVPPNPHVILLNPNTGTVSSIN